MPSWRRDISVGALAAVVTLALVVVAGCGKSEPRPRELSVAQMVAQEAAYDGAVVRTDGTVASFGEGSALHYWIEDTSSNRVGLEPGRKAAPFLGRDVVVVGTFRFDEGQGRRIIIDRIREADVGTR